VIANMRGGSPEAVATLLMQQEGLRGLQGPTISPVYTLDGSSSGAAAKHGFYACVICVAKKNLYPSVKALQKVSGVAKAVMSQVTCLCGRPMVVDTCRLYYAGL
jgi:ATP phosphoribosyltransferase